MDDGLGVGTLLAVGVDVAHNVMADQLFTGFRHVVVDIPGMGLHLIDLLLGHVQPQLVLGLRQGNPQLPPGAELVVVGEEILHLLAGVPGGQGGGVAVAVSFHGAPPQLCLLWITVCRFPCSRSMYSTNRETLLSSLRLSHSAFSREGASGAERSTATGSPAKEGSGLPSP